MDQIKPQSVDLEYRERYLRAALSIFSRMASNSRGVRVCWPQGISQNRFLALPETQQSRFVGALEKFEPIFNSQIEEADEFLEVSLDGEMKLLDAVSETYGVRFARGLRETFDEGDIIEIYDLEGIQIYRNLNFFKTTNYSLMDVLSHNWIELWDRSSAVVNQIEQMVGRVMATHWQEIIPCGVMQHLLKERAFGMTQTLAIQTKCVSKVVTLDGEPFGFILNMSATPVAVGEEAEKIGFV